MQKTKAVSAAILMFLAMASASGQTPAASSASARENNITTVDELLRVENVKALEQSRKNVQALGLEGSLTDGATSKKGAGASPPASLFVDSISGVGQDLRADVSYNGLRYERVRVGTQIGPCQVGSLLDRRVTMRLVDKKSRADQCPSAYWTGKPNPVDLAVPGINAAAGPQARPLPAGLPVGALPNSGPVPGATAPGAAVAAAR